MQRDWLRFVVSLSFMMQLLAVSGWCESLPGEMNLSLEQAIGLAINRNLEVQNESLSAFTAEIEALRSRAFYNPVLSLSADSGINAIPGDIPRTRNTTADLRLTQSLPTGGSISATSQTGYTAALSSNPEFSATDWQSSFGLNVSQPLLRNGWRETTEFPIYVADLNVKDSLERFDSVITDTLLSVITSYNRLYTLRQILESRKAALVSAEQFLAEIMLKVTPENPLAMEVADADFAFVQRRRDLVEAERNLRDHEAGFRYVIGLETKTSIIPVDPPSREEPQETEEQAVAAAFVFRPDLEQLRSSLNVAEMQARIARRQIMPELDIAASGGVSGTGGSISDNWQEIVDGKRRFWTVGLQFSYPLGNTAAVNDYRRSKVRMEQVQNQIKSLSWRIQNDVESDLRALISARLQVRMADRSLKVAEQRLDEYRRRNLAGTSTVQDVIDAENDLINARNSQANAVEVFANSVARLRRDTGMLMDYYGISLDVRHPGKLSKGGPSLPGL